MSSLGGSLYLTAPQLADIAKIQALTPKQFASLNKTEQYEYTEILAAYDDLVADNTKNAKYAGYFAGAIAGIMALFVLFHWSRWLYHRIGPKRPGPMAILVKTTRLARSLTLRKVPGFPSAGHFWVVLAYVAVMASLMFSNVTYWSDLVNWAHRLGWLAICNIALLAFLALKNTPLSFLTSYSYEKLNCLHQIAGYTTVICVIMHAVVYTVALDRSDQFSLLTESAQISGEVAGVAMLLMGLTAILLRRWHYESFYAIHITFFVIILVTVGLHRADTDLGYGQSWAVAAVIFAASIWAIDRVIRILRIWWNSLDNTATVTPLPQGGTRLTLRKTPFTFVPGKHAFLWLPSIRLAETHPFTIVSTNPLEFVVSAQHGFTGYLHAYAQQYPGASLKVSVDGPYGSLPKFSHFEKIVLVAGGSGASFALGVAAALVRNCQLKGGAQIDIVWVVKRQEQLSWFGSELQICASSSLVNLSIYSTTAIATETIPVEDVLKYGTSEKSKKSSSTRRSRLVNDTHPSSNTEMDDTSYASSSIEVHAGRPDIPEFIKSSISRSGRADKIIVAACGPSGLMNSARNETARCIASEGRSVTYHGEQFGW